MDTPSTVRLYGVMARDADVAVLIRHGPRRLAHVIRWATDTDVFEPGQWFKGQIAPETVALNSDGSLMVCSATDHGRKRLRRSAQLGDEWTAVSKPPYLTALCIWFHGWQAMTYKDVGGCFASNRCLELDDFFAERRRPNRSVGAGLKVQIAAPNDYSAPGRILRQGGWVHEQTGEAVLPAKPSAAITADEWEDYHAGLADRLFGKTRGMPVSVYAKQRNGVRLVRRRYEWRRSIDLQYRVESTPGLNLADADWADFDQQGRLVFARLGKVYGARPMANGWDEMELANFSNCEFVAVDAPDWAKRW